MPPNPSRPDDKHSANKREIDQHEADCPARGRGDEYCKCDAVPFLNDFEALAVIQPDPEPQPVAEDIVKAVWARCEALEDEAADKLGGDLPILDQGFWIGQKVTAKSIRRSTEMPALGVAGTVSVEAAARVLLAARNPDGMTVMPEYVRDMLRALAGEGGR